jgi:hypothetical protein
LDLAEANIVFVESPFAVGFSYSNVSSDYDHFSDAAIGKKKRFDHSLMLHLLNPVSFFFRSRGCIQLYYKLVTEIPSLQIQRFLSSRGELRR